MRANTVKALLVLSAILFGYRAGFCEDWATSQGSCYEKGEKIIDAGIPFPFFQVGVHGAFDYGFHDAISGGGGIGFKHNYWWGENYLTFVGRAAFHPFNLKVLHDKIKVRDIFDVYAGPTFYFGPGLGNFPEWGIREFIGARWFFAPKMALVLEDCPGFGYLDVGMSFKL